MIVPFPLSDLFVPDASPLTAFEPPPVPTTAPPPLPYVGTRPIPGSTLLETFIRGDERVSLGTTAVPDMLCVTGSTIDVRVPMQFSGVNSSTPVVSPGIQFEGSGISLDADTGVWMVSGAPIGFSSPLGVYTMGTRDGKFVIELRRPGHASEDVAVFYP